MSLGRRWRNKAAKKMLLCWSAGHSSHMSASNSDGFLPLKGFHCQEELPPLEVRELVAGKQSLLQLTVGERRVWGDDEVDHLLEGEFVQGGAQWNQAGTRPWQVRGRTSKYCGTFLLK